MEKKNIKKFCIDEEQTAISFLKKRFSSSPLSLIYKLFRTKKVRLGSDYLRYYQYRLKKGDILEVEDDKLKIDLNPKLKKPSLKFKPNIQFEILYEDENIIIVIKDHNIETHSKLNPKESLDNAVFHYLLNSGWTSSNQDFIVSSSHRLDKLTKGLVVYPKNQVSKKILHDSFSNKNIIRKKYLAFCENKKKILIPSSVSGFIYKDEDEKRMNFQSFDDGDLKMKSCAVDIKEIGSKYNFSLLEIDLITGRKHQIRSILSFLNIPIIGDKKYGSNFDLKNKIKLFGYKIEFVNLPGHLCYLNGKVFELKGIKEKLVCNLNSVQENILPKKFLKY